MRTGKRGGRTTARLPSAFHARLKERDLLLSMRPSPPPRGKPSEKRKPKAAHQALTPCRGHLAHLATLGIRAREVTTSARFANGRLTWGAQATDEERKNRAECFLPSRSLTRPNPLRSGPDQTSRAAGLGRQPRCVPALGGTRLRQRRDARPTGTNARAFSRQHRLPWHAAARHHARDACVETDWMPAHWYSAK